MRHWIVVRERYDAAWVPPREFHKHATPEEALAEAERLARKHPGVCFTIYEMGMRIEAKVSVEIQATYPADEAA